MRVAGEGHRHLLAHHDGLRLRFTRTEAGWQQFHQEQAEAGPLLSLVDLRRVACERKWERGWKLRRPNYRRAEP
jgi:hypothetical protein